MRRRFFDGFTAMAPGMREELLAFVSDRGTLLEPDAIEFLLTQRDPVERIEAFLESCPETPFVVTLDDVMRAGEIARNAAAQIATQTASPPTSARRRTATGSWKSRTRRTGSRSSFRRSRPWPRKSPSWTKSSESSGPSTTEGS